MNYTNTNLETLAIENTLLYPPFDNSITSYTAEVSNSVSNLNILAIPEAESANAEIVWDNDLKEGNNLITINVIAQDGITKKTYEINVYKRNEEEEAVYNEEQQLNKERLEEIYNLENTTATTTATSGERLNQKTIINRKINEWNIFLLITIGALIIFVSVNVFKRWKKFHLK
jgi:hypothetical protein